jgi:hypothetical protein
LPNIHTQRNSNIASAVNKKGADVPNTVSFLASTHLKSSTILDPKQAVHLECNFSHILHSGLQTKEKLLMIGAVVNTNLSLIFRSKLRSVPLTESTIGFFWFIEKDTFVFGGINAVLVSVAVNASCISLLADLCAL